MMRTRRRRRAVGACEDAVREGACFDRYATAPATTIVLAQRRDSVSPACEFTSRSRS